MPKLNLKEVTRYVEENIATFHQKRITALAENLTLKKAFGKKNPYLFKAKHVLTAPEIVKSVTDAYVSSQEETIFGDWLEGLAIYINAMVYGGKKSGIQGIDLEFDKDNTRYIVTIKSGPNWGNSRQVAGMLSDFKTAKKTLRTSNSQLNVVAVNGCCYGKDRKPDKGDYFKYCGQKFWEFISGDPNLYLEIIEPLGYKARERNDDFIIAYSQQVNKFTKEFTNLFCDDDGNIDWPKLVKFNSGEN